MLKPVPYINKRKWLGKHQVEISKLYRDGQSWKAIVSFLEEKHAMPFPINEKDFFKYCDFLLEESDFQSLEKISDQEQEIIKLKNDLGKSKAQSKAHEHNYLEYLVKHSNVEAKNGDLDKQILLLKQEIDDKTQKIQQLKSENALSERDKKGNYDLYLMEAEKHTETQKKLFDLKRGYEGLEAKNVKLTSDIRFQKLVSILAVLFGILIFGLSVLNVI